MTQLMHNDHEVKKHHHLEADEEELEKGEEGHGCKRDREPSVEKKRRGDREVLSGKAALARGCQEGNARVSEARRRAH
jgi:hypothetical protein